MSFLSRQVINSGEGGFFTTDSDQLMAKASTAFMCRAPHSCVKQRNRIQNDVIQNVHMTSFRLERTWCCLQLITFLLINLAQVCIAQAIYLSGCYERRFAKHLLKPPEELCEARTQAAAMGPSYP